MLAKFLKLPSELRNRVYGLCLLLQNPIDPWINYSQRQELTLGLLRANKTVHREASSLFYAQNRFDFTMADPEQIASFLGTIGRNNADYIQHVCVDFPNFHYQEPGGVTLSDGSMSIFASIQSSCANLSTLTAFAYSTETMEDRLEELDNPEIVTVLKLVDTHFRAILSLKKIIVGVYGDDPSCFIRREMVNRGWAIIATEYEEEWDTGQV
ncbi:hypothetical protein B0J14DRAFT_598013 [Halenospora varia]|nr:hypothetical protein B0J14DRAFT_598013 [Halenospora varia]